MVSGGRSGEASGRGCISRLVGRGVVGGCWLMVEGLLLRRGAGIARIWSVGFVDLPRPDTGLIGWRGVVLAVSFTG